MQYAVLGGICFPGTMFSVKKKNMNVAQLVPSLRSYRTYLRVVMLTSLVCTFVRAARTTTASTTAVTAAPDDTSAEQGSAATGAPAEYPHNPLELKPLAFIAKNNVNLDGDFISCREGEPRAEELTNENLIKIIAQKGSDEEVNWILWKCLGEQR